MSSNLKKKHAISLNFYNKYNFFLFFRHQTGGLPAMLGDWKGIDILSNLMKFRYLVKKNFFLIFRPYDSLQIYSAK